VKAGALALGALFAIASPWSRAESRPRVEAKPAEPEELRVVVARRARQLTGAEVRIGELRYELIGSRFVGSQIEAGPRGKPVLKLPNLIVELALLGGGAGRTIASIEASGSRISIPAEWLGRGIRTLSGHGAVTVRKVTLRGGRLTVRPGAGGGRGSAVILDGVDLDLADLVIPAAAAGDPFRASGSLKLSVKNATLGGLALRKLTVQGKLEGDRLTVELKLGGLGGSIRLAGKVGIGARLGPFDLKGHAAVRPAGAAGARVWGPLVLTGKSIEALSLEGKLRSTPQLEAQRGSGSAPPLLRMRVKVGKRELRGTPADWQLR
jgi:hypothetical protein